MTESVAAKAPEKPTTGPGSGRGGRRIGAGRPTDYSEELVQEVCRLMVDENMHLWTIAQRPLMPTYRTFWRWMAEHPEFEVAYRSAERMRAHHAVREIEDIEWLVLQGDLTPQAANFLVSSKRWRAKVMNPREFGDVQRTEVTGAAGGPVEVKDETATAARISALVNLALARQARGEKPQDDGEIDLAS